MKAIVTGAGGFVGGHLATALREAGWRVTTLARRAPADVVGDLCTMPLRGLSADVVFHLAGFSSPSASLGAPAEAYASNAAATARLLRELRAGRFVTAGSCQVYGPMTRPVDESAPCLPRTPYAASKLCAEALAFASGRDVVALRPFNHTGPGQSDSFVCPRIARQVARAEAGCGSRVLRLGDLSPRRDFFDVRDMARAYILAAERGRAGAVYNVSTGRPVSIARIARILMGAASVPLRLRGCRGRPDLLSGDSSAFRRDTGWSPRIPLERTLRDLLAHERDMQGFRNQGSGASVTPGPVAS